MHKITSLIIALFVIGSAVACKSNQGNNATEAEVIFSLSTTPCFGECPVFELSLYGDKTLIFEGKQHTEISGEKETKLSDDQFDAFLGIIESVNWAEFESEYTSNMTDLPTQNFSYNRNGVVKSVSKYGSEPRELSNMSDVILTFVEEQIFQK